MFITRKGRRIDVEQIKTCSTSTGYNIYCFRNLSETALTGPYIASAKGPDGKTCSFVYLPNMQSCIEYYLSLICCYA